MNAAREATAAAAEPLRLPHPFCDLAGTSFKHEHLPAILAEDAELAILETKTAKRRKEINTEILDKIGPAKGAICNGWSITTTKVNVQEKLREAYSYRRITKKEIGKKEEAA